VSQPFIFVGGIHALGKTTIGVWLGRWGVEPTTFGSKEIS